MELMQASRQWASRPDDERFTSLDEMVAHFRQQREISVGKVVASRGLEARPLDDDESRKSLVVLGPNGGPTIPTHWSFAQLAQRVGAPAGYLRGLPADLAADCINHGIARRPVEEIGCLLRKNGGPAELSAVTGPNYGRIWNLDVVQALQSRFGDGVTGDFTVPGEFGKAVEVSKANTTLYASDRDFFVFLADEKNRIEIPDRRNGRTGEMARGFFVWNSEVGSTSFGVATFLFDYVCMNRIVWGAEEYKEIRVRHTSGAPHRWIEEVAPAIEAYANKSTASITHAIELAREAKLGAPEKVEEFLAKRFTKARAEGIRLAHFADEDRPIESLWDAAVGITAYARGIKHQDERVKLEREAGKIMALAR
jgi:hypothetical protein